jgi:RNA polymerase sigma factor (TIGR02999 family)
MNGSTESHRVTELLVRWRRGDDNALESLIPLIYAELRKLARSYLRRERADHTLESAALVHEAYVRLTGRSCPDWQNRGHFFGVAAQLMREILVEHARRRAATKRGGGVGDLVIEEALGIPEHKNVDVLLLDDALLSLAQLDERQARIVELRFFAGLSIEETAGVLSISPATVSREWTTARVWLRHEIANSRAE